MAGRLPYDQIFQALGLSKGVISKYIRQALVAGLDWSDIETLDEGEFTANCGASKVSPLSLLRLTTHVCTWSCAAKA